MSPTEQPASPAPLSGPTGHVPAPAASSAAAAVADAPEPVIPWMSIVWFIGLLTLVFAHVWASMIHDWYDDESMSHGFFVPLLAGYIAYQDRHKLLNEPINPSWFGLVPVVIGFVLMIVGILGADFFVPRMGLMLSLIGVIWTLGGTLTLKRLWFPLFILLFMIRIPLFIYSQITFPLQILASTLAEKALTLIGIPVLRDGNILELPSRPLNVVEACSGIRSLMTLSLLSLVYGYFLDDKRWMRWVLLGFGIPIAILANASRITITGILSEYKRELADGFYHTLEGYVIFLTMAVGLFLTHQLINKLYARYYGGGRNEVRA
ncbi:MAG: exosortase [Bryobacterales bacterium]|nr:exosortase [Bryobacterales bacterium]